ncbi:phosphoribosyltransferase-like protein [Acinetobacter sp. PW68]|uniref:phosphoribosyltransferase-like protein n=1 Tax=Acinetobacter sp. PW68 TaxID=2865162 RepID=UPI001E5DF268|nr:hypothetical protein [Acinetobacter sp. PW68]MCD0186973.1 hypothetical protein [Acinetobacter sp. PW68]
MNSEDEQELENFANEKENELVDKYKFLITQNLFYIRDGLVQIRNWLSNFIDVREKIVALFVLENLVFRNFEMLEKAMMRVLIKDIKNIYEKIHNKNYDIFTWLHHLKYSKNYLNIKFIAVDKSAITQSSAVVARRFGNLVNACYMAQNDEHIESALKNNSLIIYIDDFLGSGKQFGDFLGNKIYNLSNFTNSNSHHIYTPILAMTKGIDFINKNHQMINIIPSETIKLDQSLFNQDALDSFFDKISIPREEMHITLMNICSRYGLNKSSWLGWENAMLSVIFEWGCPNQTIKLIHHEQNSTALLTNKKALTYYPLASRRA